jgi:diguanylate cyclase (GGDEF)-like protein
MADVLSLLSLSAQMVGGLLIAVLLWPVVGVIRERYLLYWAWGWSLLAIALIAMFLSFRAPPEYQPPLQSVYCLTEYGFGFLLWAGSRRYATGRPIRLPELIVLAPAAGYAVLGPVWLPDLSHLFGWHAGVLAGFFAAALWETRRFHPLDRSSTGLRLYQGALLGLTLMFLHYAALLIWAQLRLPPGFQYPHLTYSSLYDVILESVLALGMVTIATERLQAELLAANAKLAAAVTELERVSRSDPLTGLLNRRGLDDLLARPTAVPAGVLAVIDLNDLKPLNDRLGHAAGDVALQLVARGLRTLFRVTDPIVRTGGDEFLVLVPGGSADELTRRLEALDRTLLGQRLPHHPDPIDLQVAWGISGYAAPATVPDAIERADTAMYAQKTARKGGSDRGRPAPPGGDS